MFKPEIRHDVPLIPVVGNAFCFPYLVDLTVKKGILGVTGLRFDVSDDNGASLLGVHGKLWQFRRKKRTISDPSGFPILTMRSKALALRNVWSIYKGESSDENDLIYTVQESKVLQMKIRLDVFMAGNRGEICNFHVKGSYTSQNFKDYKGDTLIAEVKEKVKIGYFFKGIEKFDVRVYPGADYAFVVSLLVILNDIDGGS
nr:protein LURP-one-related 14-like [Ipomoea batatas]GMD57669.1 protein LURP-one-related 14-like [Ipomoea batatas]